MFESLVWRPKYENDNLQPTEEQLRGLFETTWHQLKLLQRASEQSVVKDWPTAMLKMTLVYCLTPMATLY
jgi:hypothetical protein